MWAGLCEMNFPSSTAIDIKRKVMFSRRTCIEAVCTNFLQSLFHMMTLGQNFSVTKFDARVKLSKRHFRNFL